MSDAEEGDGALTRLRPGAFVAGRYRLDRRIGRGRTGDVWLARDLSMLMQVVLRFLPEPVATDLAARDAVWDEVRRAMGLGHPNVVRLYEWIEDRGMVCLSMECVAGRALTELCGAGEGRVVAPRVLAGWLAQVCAGLTHAHGSGVIHRDLRPSHVMIEGRDRVRLVDFGVAWATGDALERLTGRNPWPDTVAYRSPQQLDGQAPRVADDVYTLGATIYTLLTGKPPFGGDDVEAQVREAIPPPMAERRLELGVDAGFIPEPWEEAVALCLAKDPERRPRSADELAAALLEIEQGREEAAPARIGAPARARAPVPAARAPVRPAAAQPAIPIWQVLAVVLGFILLGLVLWLGIDRPRRERARSAAREQLGPVAPPTPERVPPPVVAPAPAPVEAPPSTPEPDLRAATREQPHVNSLDMRFVPVPGIEPLFSVWETRVRDWVPFIEETRHDMGRAMFALDTDGVGERPGLNWRNPGFEQGGDHPVVGVSWEDARAFCRWLSERECIEYRLPTDAEWSVAVGKDRYPWGEVWPPPRDAANLAGEESRIGGEPWDWEVVEGWRDRHARTAPVGVGAVNAFGIADMAGNVWEWCEDWYRRGMNDAALRERYAALNKDGNGRLFRVLRGGAWNVGRRDVVLSAARWFAPPESRCANHGFRVVAVP